MRRIFTRKERLSMAVVQGVTLDGMHADHIIPFSKGGVTDVSNGRLIQASANIKKGASMVELRTWQDEFFTLWKNRIYGAPYLLAAIPGGGKTIAALYAANDWLKVDRDRRLIVCVPTTNLQEQWKDEAARLFGIELRTKELNTGFKDGFHGIVATYQSISANRLVYRALCSSAPTMAILDEPHHCGEGNNWGDGVKEGLEPCLEKLLLSGTPWRTSGESIPFVIYGNDGWAVCDYRYDYPTALEDGTVRYLSFQYDKGSCSFAINGEAVEKHLNSSISEEEAQKVLRDMLNPAGDFVYQMIFNAHEKLKQVRVEIPDAAAMAACMDQWHANAIASVIQRITGKKPSIIVSDESIATQSVRDFRKSKSEWLVSVRQVSEGTDIKRLQVLCYLTNFTTSLFFRQLVGRVSRVREMDDFEAHVFLPADPRLIRHAQEIEAWQAIALRKPRDPGKHREPCLPMGPVLKNFLGSEHYGTELAIISGETYTQTQLKEIEEWASQVKCTMEQAARAWKMHQKLNLSSHIQQREPQPAQPREDVEKKLRLDCNRKAFRIAKLTGMDVKEIHFNFKPQAQMSLDELEDKLRWLDDQLIELTS